VEGADEQRGAAAPSDGRPVLMKAIVQRRYGPPESIELADLPVPGIGDDEVLVRVHASSVNAADVEYLRGMALVRLGAPFRPRHRVIGSDVAGVVEAVGTRVTSHKVGDEVYADLSEHGFGAFAEYVAVPAEALTHMPTGLSFRQAAAVPSAACVALQGIRGQGDIGVGSRVLINGAGGGMGTFALQMAKARGAHVTAVDSAPKAELLRSLGADEVIDYRREDYTRRRERYDLILDIQAHRSVRASRRALTPGGVYRMVGGSSRRIVEAAALGTLISRTSPQTVGLLLGWPNRRRDMEEVSELLRSGAIHPVVDRSYPLAEAAAALRYVADGHVQGKVVMDITPAAAP
jgi:NADPH:quinone reductase-like Zn-dependent oxidoreductase